MFCSLKVLVAAALFVSACGPIRAERSPISIANMKEAWNAVNNPLNLRGYYEVRLARLPESGDLESKPWTDSYWPSYEGGLANRWNDPASPDAFAYPLHSQAQVRTMSENERSQLSPAEKYDIFQGNFAYPLVHRERRRTSPDDPSWFGLCHGWAAAAFNFLEPKPVTMANPDGIQIPFGSSDVKALLLYAQHQSGWARFVGSRCNAEDPTSGSPACRDINAGSFHIVLANQIGLLKEGFVAEISRASQIWNHPVYGFNTENRGQTDEVYAGAAPGTVQIITMSTTMRYIVEMGPRWDPIPFRDNPGQAGERHYNYTLEINAAGEIIGGAWSDNDHPDFFWTQTAPQLTGYFLDLGRLYAAATRG